MATLASCPGMPSLERISVESCYNSRHESNDTLVYEIARRGGQCTEIRYSKRNRNIGGCKQALALPFAARMKAWFWHG